MLIKLFLWLTRNKQRAVWIASIWTALILFACFIPGNEVPNVHIPLMDKWVHFVIFAGFSFLWLCVPRKITTGKALMAFVLAALVGYGVELVQGSGITSGRSYEFNDIVADTIGGLLGVIVFFILHYAVLRKR